MKRVKGYRKRYMALIEQLKELCVNHYNRRLQSLVVFGSVANRTFSPESDIDLLIILRSRKTNYDEFSEYYENVEKMLSTRYHHIEINPIFKKKSELHPRIPYLWNTDFLILYDSGDFFREFLKKLEQFKKRHISLRDGNLKYVEIKQ